MFVRDAYAQRVILIWATEKVELLYEPGLLMIAYPDTVVETIKSVARL